MKIQFEININDKLAALYKRLFTVKMGIFIIAVILFAAGLFLFSNPISKPHDFVAGTEIIAEEVNENFDMLYLKANELDGRVEVLEAWGLTEGQWTGDENTIYYTGNVGIGTGTPSSALDIAGTVKATAFEGDGSGLTNLPIGDSAYGAAVASPNDSVHVDADGNVGIGTTSPNAKLEVNGLLKASQPYWTGVLANSTGSNFVQGLIRTSASGITLSSGNTLTVLTSGLYLIHGQQLVTVTGPIYFCVQKNGSTVTHAYTNTINSLIDLAVDTMVELNAGDTIRFYYHGDEGTVDNCWSGGHSSAYVYFLR